MTPLLCMLAAQSTQTAESAAGPSLPAALQGAPSFGDALMRMLIALAVIVAALVILGVVVQRLKQRGFAARAGGDLRVRESLPLDPRCRLVVVEALGETLLLGVGGDRVTLLRHHAAAAPERSAEATSVASSLRNAALRQIGLADQRTEPS